MKQVVVVHDGNLSNRNQARALLCGLSKRMVFSKVREVDVTRSLDTPHTTQSLIISCGHKAAVSSSCWSQFQSPTNRRVQILHPRFLRSTSWFDCLVLPSHDSLGLMDDVSKVVRMRGALSWALGSEALGHYQRRATLGTGLVLILLGGGLVPSTHLERLRAMAEQVKTSSLVLVITSRRTDKACTSFFEARPDLFRVNPPSMHYRAALACADSVLVSCDSISMVADAIQVAEIKHPFPGEEEVIWLIPSSVHRRKHARFLTSLEHTSHIRVKPFELAGMLHSLSRRPVHVHCRQVELELDRVARQVAAMVNS